MALLARGAPPTGPVAGGGEGGAECGRLLSQHGGRERPGGRQLRQQRGLQQRGLDQAAAGEHLQKRWLVHGDVQEAAGGPEEEGRRAESRAEGEPECGR